MLSRPPCCGQSAAGGSVSAVMWATASHATATPAIPSGTASARKIDRRTRTGSTLLLAVRGTRRAPGGLLLLQRRELLVADVVEVEPADVHLVDGPIAPADERR